MHTFFNPKQPIGENFFLLYRKNVANYRVWCYNMIVICESEVFIMAVSYNKLWKLLIDKNMKKMQLKEAAGIGSTTLSKLSKNQPVSMDVMMKLCGVLDCNIGDIMDVIEKN